MNAISYLMQHRCEVDSTIERAECSTTGTGLVAAGTLQ
jgi:hypothetical protein